jgi:hypothetical protein
MAILLDETRNSLVFLRNFLYFTTVLVAVTLLWNFYMLNFEQYLARYNEFGVQAIIENLERYEGIRANITISLEERWNALMQDSPSQQRLAA